MKGAYIAVYRDSALFFKLNFTSCILKITQKMHVSPHQNFTIF